jgi:hypothetical protein
MIQLARFAVSKTEPSQKNNFENYKKVNPRHYLCGPAAE